MNELPEEIELPPMDYGLAAHEQCDVREEQLKSSLAANREQKAEIERANDRIRYIAQLFGVPDGGRYLNDWIAKSEKLASLRASVGEKPEDAWKRGWLKGWERRFRRTGVYAIPDKYVAPPTLPREEK